MPFDFDVSSHDALEEYGQQVVNRINFVRYRAKPTLSMQAFAGVDLYEKENLHIRFEADGADLNNRLNVIYFGGLFSGNTIGPNPNFGLRLVTTF